jgi:hypothetical protein
LQHCLRHGFPEFLIGEVIGGARSRGHWITKYRSYRKKRRDTIGSACSRDQA